MAVRMQLAGHRGCWAVAVIAAIVYLNTLPGQFTFDDNFALITNHDVWNGTIPLNDLFRHDFWGQDISSPQSHKSYRPITILLFRSVHHIWKLLNQLLPWIIGPALTLLQRQPTDGQSLPSGLDPFPFHVLNVVMHAAASAAVLLLANHLFACLETPPSCSLPQQPQPGGGLSTNAASPLQNRQAQPSSRAGRATAAASKQQPRSRPPAQIAGSGVSQSQGFDWLMWQQQLLPWREGSSKAQLQALACALLFALHPVHTEAVAGIVGHAELLCAVLSITGLLLYMMAVDARYAAAQQPQLSSGQGTESGIRPQLREQLQHWGLVAAAMLLAGAAALSKEIGITVVGTMLLYDVVVAPGTTPAAGKRQLLRIAVLVVVGMGYVVTRKQVAGDHLVRIYRKVENPIPFAKDRATRVMTTGYLHARYFLLLLAPIHLSADWSFACIPLVEQEHDPRNLATVALYSLLLYYLLRARPLQLAASRVRLWLSCLPFRRATAPGSQRSSQPRQSGEGEQLSDGLWHARVRLLVVLGLVVGPFFPATNILFYVGTFIGERLLYYPSIGFCWLVADVLGSLLLGITTASSTTHPSNTAAAATGTATGKQSASGAVPSDDSAGAATAAAAAATEQAAEASATSQQGSSSSRWRPRLFWALVGLVLVAYAGRTVLRNQDWVDEERLFVSAQQVCPNSAKVQHNSGILERRYHRYDMALKRFRRAQEIEPSYCEPTYWIGLTTINLGKTQEGLDALRKSVSCKYTTADALKALGQAYMMMLNSAPGNPSPLVEWGRTLAGPDVMRLADACSTIEDAALLAARNKFSTAAIDNILDACLQGLRAYDSGYLVPDSLPATTPGYLDRFGVNSTMLRKCVNARRPLYHVLAEGTPGSPKAQRAIYRYLRKVRKYPECRTPCTLRSTEEPISAHQKWIHMFQSSDPEDPWLQWEWGEAVVALNSSKVQEASVHMEVSAVMFMQVAQNLTRDSGSPVKYTGLDGKPLNASAAVEAATEPLQRLLTWMTEPQQRCAIQQRMCYLRLQVLQAVKPANVQGSVAEVAAARAVAKKAELAAKAGVRRCLIDLMAVPECRSHALQLDQLLVRMDPEHAQAMGAQHAAAPVQAHVHGVTPGQVSLQEAGRDSDDSDAYDGEL